MPALPPNGVFSIAAEIDDGSARVAAVSTPSIAFWDRFWEPYEGPLNSPNTWDIVVLGGVALPGTANVDGAAMKRIDVQKANGVDGGAIIERGYVPGKYDIDLTIWTLEQWQVWLALYPKIFRRPGKLDVNDHQKKTRASAAAVEVTRTAALPISHPALQAARVHSVIVESIALPRPGPVLGSKVITIKVIEYQPPTKASAIRRVDGAKPPTRDPRLNGQPAANRPQSPAAAGEGKP